MNTNDVALGTLASLVLEDGSPWGEVAVQRQLDDARAILDLTGPRKHFLTRPRSGSKTTDLAGIAIAVLVDQAPSAARCYVVAADRDQAALLIDAADGLIDRTPGLDRVLKVDVWKITNTRNGATLEVLAADGASTWGLRPYFVVVDEIGNWPEHKNHRKVWEGLISAWPKVPNSRLVAMTSAGEPSHFSHRIRVTALAADGWRVSEMPGPVPWLAPEDLEELRSELLPSAYDRLVLNIWADSEDRLTTRDAVIECVQHDGRVAAKDGVNYVLGLDLGFKNDATVAMICHSELIDVRRGHIDDVAEVGFTMQQRVVVDWVKRWQGTRRHPVQITDVEEWVRQAASAYGKRRFKIVVDSYQSLGLVERLNGDRFNAVDVPVTSKIQNDVATILYRLLENRMLDLPDDDALIDELSTVKLLRTNLGLRIDHDSGRHDDHAFALGLACRELAGPEGQVSKRLARSVQQHAPTPEQQLQSNLRQLAAKGDAEAVRIIGEHRSTVRRYSLGRALRGRR